MEKPSQGEKFEVPRFGVRGSILAETPIWSKGEI
jgi:hypothetical protein